MLSSSFLQKVACFFLLREALQCLWTEHILFTGCVSLCLFVAGENGQYCGMFTPDAYIWEKIGCGRLYTLELTLGDHDLSP